MAALLLVNQQAIAPVRNGLRTLAGKEELRFLSPDNVQENHRRSFLAKESRVELKKLPVSRIPPGLIIPDFESRSLGSGLGKGDAIGNI